MGNGTTRRGFMALSLAAGSFFPAGSLSAPLIGSPISAGSLPDARQIRRDYQRMVDFGPRLPGSDNHVRFVSSMARDFEALGLTVGPCEEYRHRRWSPKSFSLAVGAGSSSQMIPNTAYYVRSAPTGPEGVSGPLVHAGQFLAAPDFVPGAGRAVPEVKFNRFPPGAIVIMDATLPDISFRQRGGREYLHAPSELKETYEERPYKRLWLMPQFPLEELQQAGAVGVIIVLDVSSDMIGNNFSPHGGPYRPSIPALFVGQDTGAELRRLAAEGADATLTLHAEWVDSICPQITAILPGESDETIIVNTHTDGVNFIQENGGVGMIHLARYFSSLPQGERLRRTLVFAAWPGHIAGGRQIAGGLPEISDWMRSHPGLVDRCATAITLEHLGAQEWEDVPGRGYAYTGRNEYTNFATTGGALTQLVKNGLQKHDLNYHGIERAPGTTIGNVFHLSGVPHVGANSGPNYLLNIAENGHMDKLDAELAAKQTRMVAELIQDLDSLSAEELKHDDRTFGARPVMGEPAGVNGTCPLT